MCFDPEATYRGVLFGTAIVTLMLTADARIHEILQISADRFVEPVRVYVVKNPDGTPKYDPTTNKIVTDVIVEQRLLPKGRKRDDLRLQYDVSAARVHLRRSRVCSNRRMAVIYRASHTIRSIPKRSTLPPNGTYSSGTSGTCKQTRSTA